MGSCIYGTCKHILACRAIRNNVLIPAKFRTFTITREVDGIQVEFRADGHGSLEYRVLRKAGKTYDAS